MSLRLILEQVPDPRGRQGRDYPLWSILALIVVSLVSGRKGMKAAFELGRSLNSRQRAALGFPDTTPCHATLTGQRSQDQDAEPGPDPRCTIVPISGGDFPRGFCDDGGAAPIPRPRSLTV